MIPQAGRRLLDPLCKAAYRGLTGLLAPLRGRQHRKPPPGPCLWLHAGTRAGLEPAANLLGALRIRHPDLRVVLTVVSGAARAEAERGWAGERVTVTLLPPDTTRAARRFLAGTAPDAALCLGPGLWPNLAREADRRGLPWFWVITAALPAPWRRARRLPCLYRPTLRRPAAYLLGREADRETLAALGAPPERLTVTGSPLLDAPAPAPAREARRLRAALKGRPLLLFPGTEPGEEELLAGVCRRLPAPFGHWLMVLAPADPARAPELAEHLGRFGLATAVASRGEALGPDTRVYLLDDPEQSPLLLAAADLVVLGGTWIQGRPGADPRPAAAAARPVLYGPYLNRHREAVLALDTAGAAREAPNVNYLLAALRRWLQQPGEAAAAGRRGREAVSPHRGAVERVAELLGTYLGGSGTFPGRDPREG